MENALENGEDFTIQQDGTGCHTSNSDHNIRFPKLVPSSPDLFAFDECNNYNFSKWTNCTDSIHNLKSVL